MINSNIKVDLHIHSKCSEYKEEKDVVENSTFDNISILLDQLLSKEINLFSFTDHNRFDENLYRDTINFIKSSEKYKNKISILPGVEFDVMIDDGLVPSHFLTYFNVKNESYLSQITKVINENLLIGKDDYYTIEKYEEEIKPDVVLVHGDTSTAFVTALACYYMQIPVGHVEAGLRTYNIYSPFPEEFNRQGIVHANGDDGLTVPAYADENVSTKVIKIIQSYVGIINKMVWRK